MTRLLDRVENVVDVALAVLVVCWLVFASWMLMTQIPRVSDCERQMAAEYVFRGFGAEEADRLAWRDCR